jgi:Na+-driven multidrug efflux pump
MFGWLGLPELGLAGAATASLGARSLALGLNIRVLSRGSSRLRLSLKSCYPDVPLMVHMVRLALPASVTHAQRGLSKLAVVAIVAPFGDGAVAAFSVLSRAETVANQASHGLGKAAGALAGQNLGAGHPSRARRTVGWAIVYVTGLSLTIAALFAVFAEQVASFVNSEPGFVEQASTWLRIIAVGYFSMTAAYVFTHAFNTLGATLAPMVVTLTAMWGIEIPLAFALSNLTPLGPTGVPWAIVAGATLRLAMFAWYFGRGTWLRTGEI